MGTIGDCYDNSVAEAFFSGLQRELLDQHTWTTRDQLALAILGFPPDRGGLGYAALACS